MPGMTKKLQATFRQVEEMIQNGQANAEVAAAMEAYGYDAGRWAEGQALLETAKEKVDGNQNAFAAQLGATDSFNGAFEEAWDQAQDLAHLCAAIFEGQTEALARLGLHKRRDASTGEIVALV